MQHFCDLERKYGEAQQLISKFEEQCEALKNKLEDINVAISGS
jgi:uncharacterized protein YjbJ (UPF0337 family)